MLHRSALVVDDEPLIRMDAADIIAETGFSIVEACSVAEAIAILEGVNDIDLVFTDIQMPGNLNGIDLANLIEKRWPEILLIVASGAVKPTAHELPDKAAFIAKPFPPGSIQTAISDVCEVEEKLH